jgi:septum formation protein
MKIVLASASPRRKELLKQIGIIPEIIKTDYQEDESLVPKEQVSSNAAGKALWLIDNYNIDESLIISADTIVCIDNKVLNKPIDRDDAFNMMKELSGKRHSVLTSICVLNSNNKELKSILVETLVYMRELDEIEINAYIDTDEPYDKAGGYAIQGKASIFIDKIEGSYSNVVGLPLTELTMILKEFNFEVTAAW